MAITSLAAVFVRFEVYDPEIPLCADRGRPLGRYAYRLCYQQMASSVPSEVAPPVYARVHRILVIMTTMLVIFVALCILGLIMDLFPLHFPFDQRSIPINPSPSPPPKAPTECKLQGARQGTVQAPVSHTTGARHDLEICAAVSNSTGRVDSPTPVLAESAGAIKADSANRGRTPGVQAGPHCSTNSVAQRPASSTIGNSLSEAPSPIIGERDSNEPGAGGPGHSSPVGSCVPRGSAPNPAQLRPPPSQPTCAPGNIKKSLYPLILDPIGLIDRNDATSSSLACPSRESPWAPLDRALPVALRHLTNCYMLVVAVGVGGLKDPFIDLKFLQGIPESAVVQFRWLSNRKATPKRIRRKLRKIYINAQRAAGDSSWVLVYLTGMGDHQGNMRLFGRNTIGVQDLEGWLAEVVGPRLHVGVVFDVCRTHMSATPNRHCNLALVWSCSIEQWAYALDFGESMPSSCFLNSVFLAAHDVLVGSESFEAAFKHRMAQQGELLQFIYRKRHEANGRCKNCPESGKCDLPEPQVAEWGPAGFDTFLILGKLIISEFPHVAHRVEAKMAEKMKGWKFLCDMSVNAMVTPVDTPLGSEARHSPIIDDTSYAWEGSEAESQALAPGGVSRLVRVEFALPRNNVSIFGYSV